VPIIVSEYNQEVKREFEHFADRGTEIEVVNLAKGPASVESRYDDAVATPDVLSKVREAEEAGFNGVIVDCFGDVGVKAAREISNIPVVGAGEASMVFAAALGERFSVITVLKNLVPILSDAAKVLGVHEKLASVRYVDIPVLEVADKERLKKALYREMVNAIEKDGAHVLVLGCTGMTGVASDLSRMLKAKGYDVPVIDPSAASLKFAEALVRMGIKQSKLTYMEPPEKERTGL
jgi:allantoin racemase